jgi:hypothetical protein
MVGHLLAWEMHEHDGTWHAWVSWVQQAGGRHVHKVVDVRAGSLQPLEPPDAYSAVPRRVRGSDGLIRPWSGESGLRAGGDEGLVADGGPDPQPCLVQSALESSLADADDLSGLLRRKPLDIAQHDGGPQRLDRWGSAPSCSPALDHRVPGGDDRQPGPARRDEVRDANTTVELR